MITVKGGICAPKGFKANGIYCGFSDSHDKKDLALIVSDVVCNAACVYTPNKVKGASLAVTKENLKNGRAQAIICNAYNANALTSDGIETAEKICELVEEHVKVKSENVIVSSFGDVGKKLDLKLVEFSLPYLSDNLSQSGGRLALETIAQGDSYSKEISVSFVIDGVECKIGAIGRGVGSSVLDTTAKLIFITTDVDIEGELLSEALAISSQSSFNIISYEGNASSNDMCAIMANGLSENKKICSYDRNYMIFKDALKFVMTKIAKMIAHDDKGTTKVIECNVTGTRSTLGAQKIARRIIGDLPVRASFIDNSVNVAAIACAIGNSGVDFDINNVRICIESESSSIEVFKNGAVTDYSQDEEKRVLSADEIKILISLDEGRFGATAWVMI